MRIRHIHNIEITSKCNLKCMYCIHPGMDKARKEHMSFETFNKVMKICKILESQGDKQDLWLHGLGEPLLHPDFLEMCEMAREVLPTRHIHTSTNAIAMTREIGLKLKELGIGVHVSLHQANNAAKGIKAIYDLGIIEQLGCNPIEQANDWAGQIEWFKQPRKNTCGWLGNGWVYVYADGKIGACCTDGKALDTIGHIDEWGQVEIRQISLCKTCNLIAV